MSTYLVAFVISNFKTIQTISSRHKIKIEVAARPEAIDNNEGQFALEHAAKTIDFFIDYFNISYPLSKSTNIAVPDFSNAGMENWGLILYKESRFLINPNRTDHLIIKRINVNVISHEISHQWV